MAVLITKIQLGNFVLTINDVSIDDKVTSSLTVFVLLFSLWLGMSITTHLVYQKKPGKNL
ncbi:hypothetical protein CWD77_03180 [Rhodohalobacter barkolensis]|uniref:Uncharacterized protein n=2 Tax=Rhodohalobacter barkolensis TaxID=2053187 RepID=A0A2N0VK01_9BACT|nr:hypothetical protein CWD77_03180 [Rhodohalobacter barkolensis]